MTSVHKKLLILPNVEGPIWLTVVLFVVYSSEGAFGHHRYGGELPGLHLTLYRNRVFLRRALCT